MTGEFRPRENDHLVEPMFEALREPQEEERPRWSPRSWLLVLLLALIALIVMAVAAALPGGDG